MGLDILLCIDQMIRNKRLKLALNYLQSQPPAGTNNRIWISNGLIGPAVLNVLMFKNFALNVCKESYMQMLLNK